MTQAERDLRLIWIRRGISQARMDELLADITAKAQPGAMVGPFKIEEKKP